MNLTQKEQSDMQQNNPIRLSQDCIAGATANNTTFAMKPYGASNPSINKSQRDLTDLKLWVSCNIFVKNNLFRIKKGYFNLLYCIPAHSTDIILDRVQSMADVISIFHSLLNFCNLINIRNDMFTYIKSRIKKQKLKTNDHQVQKKLLPWAQKNQMYSSS